MKHFKNIPIILLLGLLMCGCRNNDQKNYKSGCAAIVLRSYDAAINSFTKVIKSNKGDLLYPAYYNRARYYYISSDYQSAIRDIDTLIKHLDPAKTQKLGFDTIKYSDLYMFRASLNGCLKKYHEAIVDLDKAFKAGSLDTASYFNTSAWIKKAMGDVVGAERDSIKSADIERIKSKESTPVKNHLFEDFRKSMINKTQ
jgi:tetratricopeptide (TPR) repeat protein